MKRKLLTTIILGITIISMFISCGDSTKDKDKKERKKGQRQIWKTSVKRTKNKMTRKKQAITWVWQNWGFSAKL